MLFNLSFFRAELLDTPEKNQLVMSYEKKVEPIPHDIRDLMPYKEFIHSFAVPDIEYLVPIELEYDFDYNLLVQMIAASFSSELEFIFNQNMNKYEILIHVSSNGLTVRKKLSELSGFQILSLFKIYTEEQMNLQLLMNTEEHERTAIILKRDIVRNTYKTKIANLETERNARNFSDTVCDMLDAI